MRAMAVRGFVGFILAVLAAPLAATAQPAPRIPRVGVLSAVPASYAAPYIEFGREGLRELGDVDIKTAKALGLAIPQSLLLRADQVVGP